MSSISGKPKRHHYVPRAHLPRFGRSDRVAVRWRKREKLIVTATRNVAVESGLYTERLADGKESIETEEHLADIDGRGDHLIENIIRKQSIPIDNSDRVALATYMEKQASRTPAHFNDALIDIATSYDRREIDKSAVIQYLRDKYLGFVPDNVELNGFLIMARIVQQLRAQPHSEEIFDGIKRFGNHFLRDIDEEHHFVADLYLNRNWSLEITRKPLLITSDNPVTFLRREKIKPGDCECRFHSDEIIFPLNPFLQVVLSIEPRPSVIRISKKRALYCNALQAARCDRFIIGHPDRQTVLQQLDLADRGPRMRLSTPPGWTPDKESALPGDMSRVYMWTEAPVPALSEIRAVAKKRRKRG